MNTRPMLEQNQEDTLYEENKIIYLVLTWIGDLWDWKYEESEGKFTHWCKKIMFFSLPLSLF